MDSLAGLLDSLNKFKTVKAVFVNHRINKIAPVVDSIFNELKLEKILYKNTTQEGGQYLQQSRGFLFLTFGAVYTDIFNSSKLVVSECGITKYLPYLSPADEITKTTHPLMIKLAMELFKRKGISFSLYEPFKNKTKSEIIASVNNRNLFKMTHSCRMSNIHDKKTNSLLDCGYCLNCLIKHIALVYVTGERQNIFLLDPITKENDYVAYNLNRPWKFNQIRYETIKQLICFSTGFLAGKSSLHSSTINCIDRYGNNSLFKRFSEDIVYGLSYMKNKNMIKNQELLRLINKYESEHWYNKDRVSRRRVDILIS